MTSSYKTLKSSAEGVYKEKGSKFIAIAQPIDSIEHFEHQLQLIKKKYHDARHHCYAYILGEGGDQFRANDDGEPNHSAGDPILGQIRSLELTNTMVVVVRYFGGTKLGVSGLINAYKTSAKEALSNAGVIKVNITIPLKLVYPYVSTNEAMKALDHFGVQINKQLFETDCQIEGKISPDKLEEFKNKITLLNNLGVKIDLFI